MALTTAQITAFQSFLATLDQTAQSDPAYVSTAAYAQVVANIESAIAAAESVPNPAMTTADFATLRTWLFDGKGTANVEIDLQTAVNAWVAGDQPNAWKYSLITFKNVLKAMQHILIAAQAALAAAQPASAGTTTTGA